MSRPFAEGLNRLTNGLLLALFLMFLPHVIGGFRDFVHDANSRIHIDSPFVTDSQYYHPGDIITFVIKRTANFNATFYGARILRHMMVEAGLEESPQREPIYGGIDSQTRTLVAHLRLPTHTTLGEPLPPGRYYYEFPIQYTVYNHTHSMKDKTSQFMVLDPRVAITQNLPAIKQVPDADMQTQGVVDADLQQPLPPELWNLKASSAFGPQEAGR